MINECKIVLAVAAAVGGLAMQSSCHAQSAVSSPGVNAAPQINAESFESTSTMSESSSADTPQAPVPAAKPKPGFFTRWGKAYIADWTGTTEADPNAPQRRGTPAPIPSPPFPAADWPIGGTEEIGAPDYNSYMLQTAIDGDPTKLSKVKWYGWIAVGANGSTNNRA